MLIIENGTGVTGAESYATALELRGYANKRGKTAIVSLDDTGLEALLVQAMDYITAQSFKGVAVTALPFPRSGIGFDNVIPPKVKQAQMVLAISAHTTPLMGDKTPDNTAQVASKAVGSVSISYHDSKGKTGANKPIFTHADNLLSDFYDNNQSAFGVAFLQRS